jgi:hypothetical protein
MNKKRFHKSLDSLPNLIKTFFLRGVVVQNADSVVEQIRPVFVVANCHSNGKVYCHTKQTGLFLLRFVRQN